MIIRVWRLGAEWYAQHKDSLGDFFNYGPFCSKRDAIDWAVSEGFDLAPYLLK